METVKVVGVFVSFTSEQSDILDYSRPKQALQDAFKA